VLDLVEKITAGVAGALALVTLVVYLWYGVPSTTATIFVASVVEAREEPAAPKPTPEQQATTSAEDEAIIENLRKQGVRVRPGTPLKKKPLTVPQDLFEFISSEANLLPELKKLQSHTIKGTRLKIHDIQSNSLIKKLGLQENDVIELIDGEIIEFNQQSAARYKSLFDTAQEKLRNGGEVSITVTRNNRPVHLQFKL
jgi:hypothetical protein